MKHHPISLLLVLLILLGSCQESNTTALDNFKKELVGSWESAELENEGASFSHKELLLTDKEWHLKVFTYSDPKGHDPLFKLEFTGVYEITAASQLVEGSWEGTYQIDKKHLTLLTRDAETINTLGFASCGLVYGEKMDVSQGCSFIESISECSEDYDLLTVKNGRLYAGKRTLNMCKPSGRPKTHGRPFKQMTPKESAKISVPSESASYKNVAIELLAENLQFLEGPIWEEQNKRLIFSEVNGNTLWQWKADMGISEFLKPSYYAGGNTFDGSGNIISCQGGARRLVKIDTTGNITMLADTFEGKKFNSPNDAVVKSDGTIWFTDPDYGLLVVHGENAPEFREIQGNYIFVHDPSEHTTTLVCNTLGKPNGLAFSKDESILYVGNSEEGDRRIMAFDVLPSNTLGKVKLVTTIKSNTWGVDGLKVGQDNNLYAACGDGVNIFSPSGELINVIATDFEVTNLTFGTNNETLFITGHEALYRINIKKE